LAEEYHAYNYDFPKPSVRIAQLEEAVQIVKLLWAESPASFKGAYYRIENATCEPRPDPLPPLMIGGAGEQLTLRVVAKHADWWNVTSKTVKNYRRKLNVLRGHCAAVGRDYDEIVKTWSVEGIAVARTEAEAQRIAAASPYSASPIAGTPAQVAEQLQEFVDLGAQYLVVRVLDFPSTKGIELFAREVIPRLSSSS
jgi:alkanesulfonate monooxygenase SsuD/methylene tetrahydromethanopterin reductase-like flavin-dependent oxidoreductase (luciferase family)